MQLTKQQKEEIIMELAPWLPPKKISEEFGIPQGSIYYFCNKHQIPKYQENMAYQKEEYKYEWVGLLQDITNQKMQNVRELLNDNK